MEVETQIARTRPHMDADRRLGFKAGLLIWGLALVMLLPGAHVSLFDRDEGWYAQVCREMLATGDWLVPRYLGEIWLAKPPLTYWLVTAGYALLGVGEWQARGVSVLLTAVNGVLVAALGARMLGRRTGFLAGVLFITAGLPALVGKMLLTDPAMLLCTLAAVHLHWRMAQRTPRSRDQHPLLDGEPEGVNHGRAAVYWFFIGLGILAKGPATLVFAGAFALALLATPGRRAWFWNWRYWLWFPVALMVAVPWYAYIAHHAWDSFREQFLGYEITERIAGTPHGHGGPPGYYILLSLAGLLPWTVFVPGTLIIAFRRRNEDTTLRLLLIWLAVPWIVLELIHSKLPHYIMPCYVPLAILLAHVLYEELRAARPWSAHPPHERCILDLWPGILIGIGATVVIATVLKWDARWGWAALATGAVLGVGFGITAWLLRRRSLSSAVAMAAAAAAAFHLALGIGLLPALEPFRLSRNLAQTINAAIEQGESVYLCGYEEPSTFFYLRGPGRAVKRDSLAELIAGTRRPALLAITDTELARLPENVSMSIVPRLLPESVMGFNYVKNISETIRLARLR